MAATLAFVCPRPSHGALLAGCHRATQRARGDLARSERMQVGGLGQEARAAWCYVRVFSRVRTITLEGTAQVKRHG